MPEEPNPESGSITLKLYESPPPRFAITCKNKVDFFEQFKKKCQDLGVLLKDIIWMDEDSEPMSLTNAMAFADAMIKSGGYTQRLYVMKCHCNERSSNCDDILPDVEAAEPEKPDDEAKRVSMKLFRNFATPLHIQYKDKHDLYEQYKQKTQELNLSLEHVCWHDLDGDYQSFDDADDMFDAVKHRTTLSLFVRHEK